MYIENKGYGEIQIGFYNNDITSEMKHLSNLLPSPVTSEVQDCYSFYNINGNVPYIFSRKRLEPCNNPAP